MTLRSSRMASKVAVVILMAAPWLSAGCGGEAAAALPTGTPIPVYTPWSGQAAANLPAATPTPTQEPAPPAPTATPAPTDTPAPTATTAPTDAPAPAAAQQSTPAAEGDEALDPAVAALLANADPGNGEQLTVTNGCIACHSLQEGVVMVGPSWHNLGATAATRVPGQSAAAYLYTSIVAPNAHVVEGFQPNLMPPTYRDALTAPQLADIIAYLLSLGAQ